MSQPYMMLVEQHGNAYVSFTVRKSETHWIFSTAIQKQQSLVSDKVHGYQQKCGDVEVKSRIIKIKMTTQIYNEK